MCRIVSVLVNGPTCAVEVGFCPFDKNRLLARPCPCPHPLLAGDRSMPRLPRRVPRAGLPLSCLVLAGLCACGTEPGRQPQPEEMVPVLRGAEITPALHHDESAPLRLMPVAARSVGFVEHEVKRIPRNFNTAKAPDPALQSAAPALLVPATSTNFDGVGQGFSGPAGAFTVNSAPPDTNGDVGPNHYVQIVNSDFAVFYKACTALFGLVPINTLWSGFGGGCQTNNDGDPVVLYDPMADRWVISQFSVSTTPFLQCVAVSTTPDPTASYARYSFQYASFPDYPKMGVWPDAYYETFNLFNAAGTSFLGTQICAYDRAKMLAGQAATQQCFTTSTAFGGLLPADLDGARLPPAGAPDQAGNIALGFSVSSASIHPEIRYTGRLAGDALGQMTQGEGTIVAGAGSQTGSSLSRWGDYSMLAIDPADDCTFWFTTEYIPANGAFNWKTRIGSFKFPGCGAAAANDFSITPSPASQSVQQGASTTYT